MLRFGKDFGYLVGVLLFVTSCAAQRNIDSVRQKPVPEPIPTSPSFDVLPEHEPTMDAVGRTAWTMGIIQRHILGYSNRRGILPERLEDASLPGDTLNPARLDAWGGVIRYRQGDSSYELWSAGPDRAWDTHDDMIARGVLGRQLLCVLQVSTKRVVRYPDPEGECP